MNDVEPVVTDSTHEPKELREAFDRLKAERDALLGENRSLKATTVFEKLGFPAKHADLYLKVKGDEPITAESVSGFITEYDLAPASAPATEAAPSTSAAPAQETAPGLAGMAAAATAPPLSTPASGKKMTQEEFQALLVTDTAAATRAYVEGRVETVAGNPMVSQAKRQGLIR